MIKFFQKIRQNLIVENKTSKYFKYAIGEIVLVVIGILIALQLNDWNDARKNQNYEQEILLLINQNLENDSIVLTEGLKKSKKANKLTDKLLEQVALGNYGDSLNYWMGKIICFERFNSQSSAFEVLKSKGIETISNNELQLALISYYDETLYNLYQALNDVEGSFKADWLPVIKQEFSDFKWREYCKPTDSKAFFENPSNLTLFKLYKDNRLGSVYNLEQALEKISEIKKLSKTTQND